MNSIIRYLATGSSFHTSFKAVVLAYFSIVPFLAFFEHVHILTALFAGGLALTVSLAALQFQPFIFFLILSLFISLFIQYFFQKKQGGVRLLMRTLLHIILAIIIFLPLQIVMGGALGIFYDIYINGNMA